AEYCGAGKSFTHTGHKLRIMDAKGWFPTSSPFGWTLPHPTIEAVWDQNGAVCVSTPRMAVFDPKVPMDPNIAGEIATWCGVKQPPPCPNAWFGFSQQWKLHGQLVTATDP